VKNSQKNFAGKYVLLLWLNAQAFPVTDNCARKDTTILFLYLKKCIVMQLLVFLSLLGAGWINFGYRCVGIADKQRNNFHLPQNSIRISQFPANQQTQLASVTYTGSHSTLNELGVLKILSWNNQCNGRWKFNGKIPLLHKLWKEAIVTMVVLFRRLPRETEVNHE
jgi:hypothetical protein